MRTRLLASLLIWICAVNAYSDEDHLASCRSFYNGLKSLNVRQPPRRVLLVPLLSRDPRANENPRWSEQSARIVKAFYRNRFNAAVTQLHDIWSWSDYYRQAEQMARQSPPFDRVVFIGHGGFDGPVLKSAMYWQDFKIAGDEGRFIKFSEAQPGLKKVVSVTYNTEKNREFSDFMVSRWPEFAPMKSNDIQRLLKGLEKQIQPLDRSCYALYCSPDQLAAVAENQREARLNLCELICREPLFELKASTEVSQERFFHFIKSLSSLAATDGLIFFGTCNPGSAAPDKEPDPYETEFLINSDLANGPHMSYVHLVSAATGRATAGPIGQSSAEDIVNRLIMLETHRPQYYLCIVDPATKMSN